MRSVSKAAPKERRGYRRPFKQALLPHSGRGRTAADWLVPGGLDDLLTATASLAAIRRTRPPSPQRGHSGPGADGWWPGSVDSIAARRLAADRLDRQHVSAPVTLTKLKPRLPGHVGAGQGDLFLGTPMRRRFTGVRGGAHRDGTAWMDGTGRCPFSSDERLIPRTALARKAGRQGSDRSATGVTHAPRPYGPRWWARAGKRSRCDLPNGALARRDPARLAPRAARVIPMIPGLGPAGKVPLEAALRDLCSTLGYRVGKGCARARVI